MKTRITNSEVVKGDLFGGEIEPGTFHVHNYADVSDNGTEMPIEIAADENSEAAMALGSLIPPIETDIFAN